MLYLCAYLFDGIRGLFKENVCGGGGMIEVVVV